MEEERGKYMKKELAKLLKLFLRASGFVSVGYCDVRKKNGERR
jgi:hypothetical protein